MSEGIIIDPVDKRRRWKWNTQTVLNWLAALASIVGAAASWYAANRASADARLSVLAEHRPVLEIANFEFRDKHNLWLTIKNSGRSTALKPHDDLYADVGVVEGTPTGMKFRCKAVIPTGRILFPDVASGATIETTASIPGEGWLNMYHVHFGTNTSVRLRGTFHYHDGDNNQFELPWCYEIMMPEAGPKPGVHPCFETDTSMNEK